MSKLSKKHKNLNEKPDYYILDRTHDSIGEEGKGIEVP
jgi:hypothetical protein